MDFYYAAIKSVDADAYDIRQPAICGKTAKIFFADVCDKIKVYRFTDNFFIRRNNKISQLLALCDIPAPRVQTCCYMRTWFETYDYHPDKTMYEHNLESPLSDQEKFTIYQELMKIEYAISKISMSDIGNMPYKFYSQIYHVKYKEASTAPVAAARSAAIYAISRMGKMHLFHNDPTPGNILLSPDRHVSCLIDLDGMCVSNTYFALIKMLQYCPDYMWSDLLRYYETISRQKLPNTMIISTMELLRKIKKDWSHFVPMNDMSR